MYMSRPTVIASRNTRVLVIGASGFLGQHIVEMLPENWDVVQASRRQRGPAWKTVDLADAATFSCFGQFDAVVNAGHSSRVSSRGALEHCLREGVVFMEATHDSRHMRELLALRASLTDPQGTAILGMGVFPGLTNLMAREALAQAPGADHLEILLRVGVVSGAGRSMCRHMMQHLQSRPFYFEEAQLCHGAPMQLAPLNGCNGDVSPRQEGGNSVLVGFPESLMLHESAATRNIVTALRLKPAWMNGILRSAGWLVRRAPLVGRLVEAGMILGRSILLRWLPASLEIAAVARSKECMSPLARVDVHCGDGARCAAAAIAGGLELLMERRPLPRGVFTPDELLSLNELFPRIAHSSPGGRGCELQWTINGNSNTQVANRTRT